MNIKTNLAAAGLSLAMSTPAISGPSSEVAFDAATRALLRGGDAAAGQVLAEKKCDKCHGAEGPGLSDDTDDPNLAGQMATYTFKQLMDYQSKNRDSRTMYKKIKGLEVKDFIDLATYYATLERPAADPDAAVDEATLKLVFKGDPKRMLKPCASCHGRSGQGGKYDSAALTGQRRGYFMATMAELQDEDRENDIYARMRLIAAQLTEAEIEGLANYYTAADPE